jgi:hypothetical protein
VHRSAADAIDAQVVPGMALQQDVEVRNAVGIATAGNLEESPFSAEQREAPTLLGEHGGEPLGGHVIHH